MYNFLDVNKMKEKYQYEEKENLLEFIVPFTILSSTNKTLKMTGKIIGLVPPEGFEDKLFVVEHYFYGHGQKKYEYECKVAFTKGLAECKLEEPTCSIDKPTYIGAVYSEGGSYRKYEPFVYSLTTYKGEKPVVIEKVHGGVIKNYFEIDGNYYLAEADPLRDVANGKVEEIKNKVKEKIEYFIGKVITEEQKRREFPVGLYKGYAPVKYFCETLAFESSYRKNGYGIVIQGNSYRGRIKTFNHFLYIHNYERDEMKDDIKIFDKKLIGEELTRYKEGEKVIVNPGVFKKEGIEGHEGTVLKTEQDRVKVKFYDTFITDFYPMEIRRKN